MASCKRPSMHTFFFTYAVWKRNEVFTRFDSSVICFCCAKILLVFTEYCASTVPTPGSKRFIIKTL